VKGNVWALDWQAATQGGHIDEFLHFNMDHGVTADTIYTCPPRVGAQPVTCVPPAPQPVTP
jgi:hypothetical protein